MQKITTSLWYNDNAEEAANFYVSLFDNSSIRGVSRYGDGGPGAPGSAMMVDFELSGQRFNALNGGPMFTFTEAISMSVGCDGQDEVDFFWNAFTADGGTESQCGWLKDRFGLSWQIVPKQLGELMASSAPGASHRVVQSMLTMHKIDIAELQRAHDDA